MKLWLGKNKNALRNIGLWSIFMVLPSLAGAFIPAPNQSTPLISMVILLTMVLNVSSLYFGFLGAARSVFSPTDSFIETVRYVFSKRYIATVFGVGVFAVAIVCIPPIASLGAWVIPISLVSSLSFLVAWLALTFGMKRLYENWFYEDLLSEKEAEEYKSKLGAKRPKPEKTGLFLLDINKRVHDVSTRVFNVDRKREHKLFLAPVQSLFVLIAPTIALGWMTYIFDVQTLSYVAAATSPILTCIAAALWAVWRAKGGFRGAINRRRGYPSKTYSNV